MEVFAYKKGTAPNFCKKKACLEARHEYIKERDRKWYAKNKEKLEDARRRSYNKRKYETMKPNGYYSDMLKREKIKEKEGKGMYSANWKPSTI